MGNAGAVDGFGTSFGGVGASIRDKSVRAALMEAAVIRAPCTLACALVSSVVIAPEVIARLEMAFAAFERDHAEERGNLLALASGSRRRRRLRASAVTRWNVMSFSRRIRPSMLAEVLATMRRDTRKSSDGNDIKAKLRSVVGWAGANAKTQAGHTEAP